MRCVPLGGCAPHFSLRFFARVAALPSRVADYSAAGASRFGVDVQLLFAGVVLALAAVAEPALAGAAFVLAAFLDCAQILAAGVAFPAPGVDQPLAVGVAFLAPGVDQPPAVGAQSLAAAAVPLLAASALLVVGCCALVLLAAAPVVLDFGEILVAVASVAGTLFAAVPAARAVHLGPGAVVPAPVRDYCCCCCCYCEPILRQSTT